MREAIEQRGGHLGIAQNANAARGANARWSRRRRGHEFSLEGRTALVTGAVRESERRSPKRSHSTARESRSVTSTMKARIAPAGLLPKKGPAVVQLRCDVAEETSVAALTDWAMEHRTLLMYTRRRPHNHPSVLPISAIYTICGNADELRVFCRYFDRLIIGNSARNSCILTRI
jgi:hypothetical protein